MTSVFLANLFDMQPTTIILIVVLVVLLFGGSKLPELARGLGKARREFKRASDEIEDEVRTALDEDERKRAKLEEEERVKVRAKIEEEERAKLSAGQDKKPEA
ncbi:MAG: twin-arginine translocase TatA/TatE family subunit [Puniceicoccales bacterium]|jgi:sec-independent protein translocase protein TatA|nr:twin-arginine translocase TatA/TatE family subunit [Puniceicoccales bacterium]